MIIVILSLILFLVFTVLGAFHFYWLFGGDYGIESVIPSIDAETSLPNIPQFATLIVGLGLVLFGLLYLLRSGLMDMQIPNWVSYYGYCFIPFIFILRAIGEFKYVGFFKKIKGTKFATADSKLFSPLCLGIGLIGIILQLL